MLNYGTKYSGVEFNEYHKHKNTIFYALFWTNRVHNYELGLNTIDPKNLWIMNDFIFIDKSKFHLHFLNYDSEFALIEIPDDAIVCVEEDSFKTDKMIINKIMRFNDVGDEFWIDILSRDGRAILYIKNQTDEICIQAVQYHGPLLKYVNNQTYDICKSAVRQNGDALEYVKEQTEKICKLAVQNSSFAFEYVKTQTEDICDIMTKHNGLLLRYVDEQFKTIKVCKSAVEQNCLALQCVTEEFHQVYYQTCYQTCCQACRWACHQDCHQECHWDYHQDCCHACYQNCYLANPDTKDIQTISWII